MKNFLNESGLSLVELLLAVVLLCAAITTASVSFPVMMHGHVRNHDQERLAMAVQEQMASITGRHYPYIYLTKKADFTVGLPSCSCDKSSDELDGNFDGRTGTATGFPPQKTEVYGIPINLHTCVVKYDPLSGSTFCPNVNPEATVARSVTVVGSYTDARGEVHRLSATTVISSPNPISAASGATMVQGHVYASENSAPLSGIPVVAFDNGQEVATDWTDARGAFRLTQLPASAIVSPAMEGNNETFSSSGSDFYVQKSPVPLQVNAVPGTLIVASEAPMTSLSPATVSVIQPNPFFLAVAGVGTKGVATTTLRVSASAGAYHVYCSAPGSGGVLQEAINSPTPTTTPGGATREFTCS